MSNRFAETIDGFFGARDDFTARARHENFPVASRLLPRDVRSQLMAIYAFALDWLDNELALAGEGRAIHPVFQRLTPVIQDLHLTLEPFRSLIEANRVDQIVTRYATFADLVEYCMLSAAPVGHLVLAVFKSSSAQRIEWSDSVCIALQLVEHLQDVGEDARRGRIYLPIEDLVEFECTEEDLLRPSTSAGLRDLIAMESRRTRELLESGPPLTASLPFRASLAVAGFVAGGVAAVESIERADYDVLSVRCRPSKRGIGEHMVRGVTQAIVQKGTQ